MTQTDTIYRSGFAAILRYGLILNPNLHLFINNYPYLQLDLEVPRDILIRAFNDHMNYQKTKLEIMNSAN